MPTDALLACSPWVRWAKVQEDRGIAGEWVDFDHVLTVIERGQAEFVFDGMRRRAPTGTILLIPPGVRHVVRSPAGRTLIQHIVHFDLAYDARRAAQRRVGVSNLPEPATYPMETSPFAGRLPWAELPEPAVDSCRARFAELRRLTGTGTPAAHLRRQACVLDLLALLLEHASADARPVPAVKPSRAWAALDRAVRCIQAQYADPALDIAAIARGAGVRPSYLPELFRGQLGVPVRRYLLHIRIRRARELLAAGRSVTETASEAGFSGIHAFSRAFSRVVGMPPSAAVDPTPG